MRKDGAKNRPGDVRQRTPAVRRSRVPPERTVKPNGRRRCGATNRDGSICDNEAVMANGRCRMHGGPTPTGLLNPNTTVGLYSQDLPPNLLGRFEAALTDRDLLTHERDAALIQAMIGEKLGILREALENPDLNNITERVEKIASGYKMWDWTRMESELQGLREAITARSQQEQVLREVRELIKERSAVVALENRRKVELRQSISVEQAMVLMQGMIAILRRYILPLQEGAPAPDGQEMMKAISADFRALASVRDRPDAS